MPTKLFAMIIGAVLLLGAATAWAITSLPSTAAVSIILLALVGLRLLLARKSS